MADRVQKQLEDFVPDLQELLSQDLFSPKEVKNIVDKRRQFEFDILSPDPNVSLISYKKYLEYELELDRVLQSRYRDVKKLKRARLTAGNGVENWTDGTTPRGKKVRVEIDSKRHIHRIFRRFLSRFVNNTEAYTMYLNFCTRIKAHKLFERVIMDALSKNPNEENMWLIMASYVLKTKGILASKNIIQRALRVNPKSLGLILFLFQLEVKSLLEVVAADPKYLDDMTNIAESVNRYLVIFGYGYDNLTTPDLIVFYFSFLSTLNELLKLDLFKDELDQLLDRINEQVESLNIPIVILYNYQIKLLETLLYPLTNKDPDATPSGTDQDDLSDLIKRRPDTPGLMVLLLQFLSNTIGMDKIEEPENHSALVLDLNPIDDEKEAPKYESFEAHVSLYEKDYLVDKYCVLENLYYICLLGDLPRHYKLSDCKRTGTLVTEDQLAYLKKLFSDHYKSRLSSDLSPQLLKLNPSTTPEIYYYLKLLENLSKLFSGDVEARGTTTSIHNRIKEITLRLTETNGSNAIFDGLAHLILRLDLEFELKLKIFASFKSLTLSHFHQFVNQLFKTDLTSGERVDLFLLLFKFNQEPSVFTDFLNRLNDLDVFCSSLGHVLKHSDAVLFNHSVSHISNLIDSELNCFDETLTNVEKTNLEHLVKKLNELLKCKNIALSPVNNRSLADLNVKLGLFNLSVQY